MMEQWQYTLANWVIFTGLGYGAYRYYSQNQKKKNQPVLSRTAASQGRELQQDTKQARGRRRDGTFDLDGGEKPKLALHEQGKKRKPERPKPANRFESLHVERGDHKSESEDNNDKEWAAQLDNLRKGTNLAAPQRKETRVKTVKQSSANRTPELSATSSTTGGDADDDLSPANSPSLGATNGASSVHHAANVVADMLEPVAAAPSILRVAPSEVKPKAQAEQGWEVAGGKKVQPKKSEGAVKAGAEVETKKQRQNKRKAEEQKAQREVDEKARRALMEQQRRTAREARGEPAKNGLAPPPASNSWSSNKAGGAVSPPSINGSSGPLLDTYNDAASTASSSNAPKHDASSPVSNTTSHSFWDHLPSEEEQMRRLAEEDESSWNTVTDKKKERKKKAKDAQVGGGDLTDASTNGKRPDSPMTNGNSKPFDFEQYRQQDDSDWAVA